MSKKSNQKGTDNYAKAVEDYKEKYKKEAENLVQTVFPRKVTDLNGLLEDDKFALQRLRKIADDVNIPIPDPQTYLINNGDEPAAKKAKMDNVSNNFLMGSKVLLLPNGMARTNRNIVELIDLVKPHIVELIEHANHIKMWIAYLIPRIEDGNNFGVSVQEDTMAEARQVEAEAAAYLDQISRYFMTRGKIIAKIAKYPHVEDIRRTVIELDEKEFISLRLVLCELRNHYANLHDVIIKNFDKIKKPRSSNSHSMY